MEIPEQELRDLPLADADELRAFVDKRRWFEARLQTLRALPPIYPFVQLHGHEGCEWTVPSREVLKAWRAERDKLELEVFAFDGGDLGRMKNKTREVTSIPLTAPSTHLVSITLTTIVLVDKLLSLLRARGQTLDLTATRIEWDDLRDNAEKEVQGLDNEVRELVGGRARWNPHARRQSEGAPILNSPGTFGMRSMGTPKARTATSLVLPLLHSQIANLRIRHRTLKTTTLVRTGTVLDKMIDKAAGLRGLGGLYGPDKGKGGGAVPDEFLDAMDALDEDALRVERLIDVCEALEVQWREAAAAHAAFLAIETRAANLLAEISNATTISQLDGIKSAIEALDVAHSRPISTTPIHADFPDLGQHNERVAKALDRARDKANDARGKCSLALEARAKLVTARTGLAAATEAAQTLGVKLDELGQWFTSGPGRPDLDDLGCFIGDKTEWITMLHEKTVAADELRARASKAAQQGVLALLRHKQALGVDAAMAEDQELRNATLASSEELEAAMKTLWGSVEVANKEMALLHQARKVATASTRIEQEMANLEATLREAIEGAKWPALNSTSGDPDHNALQLQVDVLGKNISTDLTPPVETLNARLPPHHGLREHVTNTCRQLSAKHGILMEFQSALRRIDRQRKVMNDVQRECEILEFATQELGQRLSERQASLDAWDGSSPIIDLVACNHDVATLGRRITSFTDTLADRIPFVTPVAIITTTSTLSPRAEHAMRDDSCLASVDKDTLKLQDLDIQVRATANDLSSNLSAAFDRLQVLQAGMKVAYTYKRIEQALQEATDLRLCVGETRQSCQQHMADLTTASQHVGVQLNEMRSLQASLSHNIRSLEKEVEAKRSALEELEGLVTSSEQELMESQPEAIGLARTGLGVEMEGVIALETEICALVDQLESVLKTENDRALLAPPTDPSAADYGGGVMPPTFPSAYEVSPSPPRSALPPTEDLCSAGVVATNSTASVDPVRRGSPSSPSSHRSSFNITERDLPSLRPDLYQSDVFGPHTLASSRDRTLPLGNSAVSLTSEDISRRISHLRDKLDEVNLDAVVYPSSDVHDKRLSLRRLPTPAAAAKLKAALYAVSQETEDMVVAPDHRDYEEFAALTDAVRTRKALLPQLGHLAVFASAAADTEVAMSQLLNQVDEQRPGGKTGALEAAEAEAVQAFERAEKAALMVESDSRVVRELRRLEKALGELRALGQQTLKSDFDGESDGDVSVATSCTVSTQSQASQRARKIQYPSRLPKSQSIRTVSNPLSASVTASTEASRSRAVSDRAPLPRFRKDPVTLSTIPGTPDASTQRVESTSCIPRPVRRGVLSSPSPARARTTSKTSVVPINKGKSLSRSTAKTGFERPKLPESGIRAYVSNPKNKLDVAVGKIVNELKVDVPIAPVGLDWQDESGKYWIGAEGRAKLCFCRILRSRTVMVRVGGGWAELSRFLLDHFADEMVQLPAAISISPPSQVTTLPETPISRHTRETTPAYPSPVKSADGSPLSLVALQLIRKASESPPGHDRERERMWSPRRSLLG